MNVINPQLGAGGPLHPPPASVAVPAPPLLPTVVPPAPAPTGGGAPGPTLLVQPAAAATRTATPTRIAVRPPMRASHNIRPLWGDQSLFIEREDSGARA